MAESSPGESCDLGRPGWVRKGHVLGERRRRSDERASDPRPDLRAAAAYRGSPGGLRGRLSDTVIPRLSAADADLDRVHILDGVRDQDGRLSAFSLAHRSAGQVLERASRGPPGDHRSHRRLHGACRREGSSRRGGAGHSQPLADLANRSGATILTVKHLNKDEAKTVASRVGGSVAYVNVSRDCFVIATDPEDDKRRILAPFKWNLNAPRPPSIAWAMEPPAPEHLASILASCDHLGEEDKSVLATPGQPSIFGSPEGPEG